MPTRKAAERIRSNSQALPPISEVAARVRDGENYRDLAIEYGIDHLGLSNRLRNAGYRFDTGEPEHQAVRREMKENLRSVLRTWLEPWMEDASCARVDPEFWFPEKGQSVKEAKRICSACPVVNECREYALSRKERFGVWGASSERERRKMWQERAA